MIAILHSLGMLVADMFKSRWRLEAENLFLRHQLSIALRLAPVCTENLVRFDLTTESLNVDHNGRADIRRLEPVRLDLQAQEPT
jgi:hypothetical protein